MFLPALPRKPTGAGTKAAGLNHRLGVRPPEGIRFAFVTTLGRAALSSDPSLSGSPLTKTLKGTPELSVTMLLSCQPLLSSPSKPFFPFPKGRSDVALAAKLWRMAELGRPR